MSTVEVEHLVEPAEKLLKRIGSFDLNTLCDELPISVVEARRLIRVMANRRLIEPVIDPPPDLTPLAAFWWELKQEVAFLLNRVPAPTEAHFANENQGWWARLRVGGQPPPVKATIITTL